MSIESSAAYAELIASDGFHNAANAAFEASPEDYHDSRLAIDGLLLAVSNGHKQSVDLRIWEMRRQLVLGQIKGEDYGAFSDTLHRLGGLAEPGDKTVEDLGPGEYEAIKTNYRVTALREVHDEPIDYLSAALAAIDERRAESGLRAKVGPENYATALKFFTDKYISFPSQHLDQRLISGLVTETMEGFTTIAEKETPNIVEMSNIYFAIRQLPTGTFDVRFSGPLIKHSLENLPDYGNNSVEGNGALSAMIAALGKLDLSQYAHEASALIDLAIRQGKKFDTSQDYLSALKVISHIPANPGANRLFASFLAARNNLEQVLTIEDCDFANERLATIVERTIDDPQLSLIAQNLARKNTIRAGQMLQRMQHMGDLSERRLTQLKEIVRNTAANFSRI